MESNKGLTLLSFLELREYTEDEKRFMIELEFVQALSNVFYLKWLSDNGYFEDEAFLRYLQYLQYWKQPEYARYLIYPECLYFLDKLQDEAFRYLLTDQNHINFLNLQCHLAIRKHSELPKERKTQSMEEEDKTSDEVCQNADVSFLVC
ncbi:hypothetical protein JH06_4417 [Blastocystis sp. subtype 4]|uniref:hypothetical protein n=1 Tax=Blastocystis sp. subtype 4 TaxID=944170 RepID=UPI000711BE62|nr:hypothetical protein JH06_4417 [Blastocystis sp. subtype 4]KNB42083.1 hypothetical protein JH06_4417 [Blastocystis sp. subtype 4]|eukprot:XP_014525526.1 hypothetical protein JH06_4417 [Blastocystis sp. subtype 4]